MYKLKVILIDDDFKALDFLELKLSKLDNIQVLGKCETLIDGIKLIQITKPDIVFLDIELSSNSGFELLNFFESPSFKVICITGHPKYAIEAIKYRVFDYIVKPIIDIELKTAIDNYRLEYIEVPGSSKTQSYVDPLLDSGRISLLTNKGFEIFELDLITRLRADGSYCNLFFGNGQKIMTTRNLKYYEEKLINRNFVRINRQDLVNMCYIQKLHKGRYPILELKNGIQLQVSDRKRKTLRAILNQ